MKKDVIIACDFNGKEQLFDFLDKLIAELYFVQLFLFYSFLPLILFLLHIIKVFHLNRMSRIFHQLGIHQQNYTSLNIL